MNQSFPVTQLRRLVLLFAVWNAVRVWTAIAWRDVLAEFSARPGMWYNIVSGVFWIAAGVYLWWMLVRGMLGTRKWLLAASAGFTVWFWIENLFIRQARENWLFVLIVNLVILILIYIFSSFIEERGV